MIICNIVTGLLSHCRKSHLLKTKEQIRASSHLNVWQSHPQRGLEAPQQGEVDKGHKANADCSLAAACKEMQVPALCDNINYIASRALSSTLGHLFCSGTWWPQTSPKAEKYAGATFAYSSSQRLNQ